MKTSDIEKIEKQLENNITELITETREKFIDQTAVKDEILKMSTVERFVYLKGVDAGIACGINEALFDPASMLKRLTDK